ncbi:MAG: hypothetical protein PUD92_05635 [Clostridiales bacterium]|nr:hypothetical protein [Clostridiales bacterium]
MKKNSFIFFILTLFILLSSANAFASSATSIFVENTSVAVNEEILVPIKINNNTGICGATLSVSYDNSLVLKSISVGEALGSLIMTKPGNLASNPFNLVFDGIEEDSTNGVIAYLCFNVMSESGTYDISVTYEAGDIVNGNLEALEVETLGGQVTVGTSPGGGTGDEGGDNEDVEKHDNPIITIGNVTANPVESIDVPVYMAGNTGICGTTLKIAYDEALTLTGITKGDALSGLIMTKPGNLSANPFNLVFDGIEEDVTNGLFFTLTFTAPQGNGIYDITATYEEGDIVNGDLMPIDVFLKKGSITVGSKIIEVIIGDKIVGLPSITETSGDIYVAFYNDSEMMTSVKVFDLNNPKITVAEDATATYAKVFCWTDVLAPLCESQKITLK